MTAPDVASVRVALVGYGEVGGILGAALVRRGVGAVHAYDVAMHDPARRAGMLERARTDRVRACDSSAAAVGDADLVISAVTASATRDAADTAAQSMRPGAFFLDLNSASPGTKTGCGAVVDAAGAHYVEAAVMTSVPPYGIRVPMLIGGPHARALSPLLDALGFAANVVSDALGVASAIKMCRSVVVKGMEALLVESFLTARRYGVEDAVIASLAETFPGLDWERNGSYFWQRVIRHGRRRAEEMREAAVTVREAGVAPLMAAATAERQAWMAALAAEGVFAQAADDAPWRDYADRVARDAD